MPPKIEVIAKHRSHQALVFARLGNGLFDLNKCMLCDLVLGLKSMFSEITFALKIF